MNRLLQAISRVPIVFYFLSALPVWALEPDPRRAESPVALVMYVTVALVLGFGFLYVWWRSKKDREKEQRKRQRSGT